MRIVVALGGNALLRRSDPMTTAVQRRNISIAAQALAPLAAEHSLIVVHGNGPQVGLLSLQAESYRGAEPYPLDVLDAGTQGMIGYLVQQELRRVLPPDRPVVTVLTMITVDPDDPAFTNPTKFVGPTYSQADADALARTKAGHSGPTARRGAAWCPPPNRSRSSRSSRSPGCSSGARWWSAQAAAASPRCAPLRPQASCPASKPSSTKTWPASCCPRTSARTCSSWPPTWTASTSTGAPPHSEGWAR